MSNQEKSPAIINFNYNLSSNIVLSYTFGKQRDDLLLNLNGNLISLLSFNFGFGGPYANDL